jgi:LuxR family maltose regulon positive regulatory protein
VWHTIRGELDKAMRLYVKGEAWNGLLQMIDRSDRQLVRRGLERDVADALSHVPPAARGRRRANLIDYAAFQTWGGDRQAAEDTLVRLTDQRSEPSEQGLIDVLHASRVRLHGRGASAAEAATAALTAIGAGELGPRRLAGISASDLEALTRSLRGTARWYEGDVAGARSDFESAIDRPSRLLPWELRAEGGLALLEASVGHLTRAESLARNALTRAERNGLQRNQSLVEALLAIAMVHRQRNDLGKVVRPLGTAQHLAKTGHEAVPLALAMIEQARDELAGGDVQEGFDTLSESRGALAGVDSSRFTRLADAVEAQLLLATGRGDRALKVLTAGGPTHDSDVCANTVRALLELRMVDEAVRSLEEWQRASEFRPMLQRRMWAAVIDHVAGSRRTATRSFAEVAVEAEAEGFVRLFVDAGPLVARLLNETLVLQPSDYLAAVSMQLSTPNAPGALHDGAPLRDIPALLSQRELEVVRYLPTRLSAIEIAEHLYISYNTLKSHMRSIYRKFGVSSRQELIRRAEELGLA